VRRFPIGAWPLRLASTVAMEDATFLTAREGVSVERIRDLTEAQIVKDSNPALHDQLRACFTRQDLTRSDTWSDIVVADLPERRITGAMDTRPPYGP
jgi:hypothetical protein